MKLGAYFNGGSAEVFGRPAETVQGRYGFYMVADQALLRWGDPAEKRHLGAFAAFVCAPDQRVNTMPYFFDAGLVEYGFFPSRPRDFASFGVAYGSYSGNLRRAKEVQSLADPTTVVQTWEMTLELNYGCTVRPGYSCAESAIHHQPRRQQGRPERARDRGERRVQLLSLPVICTGLWGRVLRLPPTSLLSYIACR